MVFVAFWAGRVNWLTPLLADWRAEMGMIKSLGGAEFVGVSLWKKVAVKVVLKMPVYLSLTRLPRSKIIFWGWRQRERYSVVSLRYSHLMPGGMTGSAVEVRPGMS